MRFVGLFALPLILLGCSEGDRGVALTQGQALGQKVADQAGSLAKSAWDRIADRASKLTPESAAESLRDTRDSLTGAVAKLEPGKRLDEAKAQLDRVRAAIDVQEARREIERRVTEAQKLADNAGKTADDVKRQLDDADQSYRDLNSRLTESEKIYDSATERVSALRDSVVHKIDESIK